MANVKNYGLSGVGVDIQLGRIGPRIINNSGTFNFKASNGTTDAAITANAVTAMVGNITATAGNLILSTNSGIISIGGTSVLARNANGYPQIPGATALQIPSGNNAARPVTPSVGMIRVSTEVTPAVVEYYDGTQWTGVSSTTTLDDIFPGTNGQIIYNVAGSWTAGVPGSASNVQPYDLGLSNLAAKTTTGLISQTGNDTYTSVTLVAPAAGLTITNANGVAGNPTFALADDLAALEGLTTNGLIIRTGTGTATTRTITGTAGRITVANGDGITGNPTLDLATVANSGTGTFLKLVVDSYGRVTGTSAVTTSDITTLVGGIYVDVTGDSMSGNLTMTGGSTVTGLPDPVNASDAANKNYVDNAIAGISWKTAVHAGTVANITLSGTQTIDGVALSIGDRVLVRNQTTTSENGIYIVASGAWVRSLDANTPQELEGAAVFVQQGTANANSGWVQTADITTIGISPVIWSQFSGSSTYIAGNGLDLTGNTFSVNFGAGIAQLPADNVGIDLYNSANSALILTNNGTTRSTLAGDQLALLIPAGSGLTQDSTGLYIGNGQVTNAKLANSSISLAADSGTGTVSLGGTLTVNGTSAQGISTSVATGTITVTAANATTTTKGVASFNTASFSVSSGAVSLNTVDVGHGGTGQTSFTTGQVLYGNGTGPISTSANLTFDGLAILQLGGATGVTISGGATPVISSLNTNADIRINPNGTGSVVINGAGAGKLASGTGQTLTITADTGLTLASIANNVTVSLAASTSPKVRISGPTDVQYATGLTSVDLTNKYYVDNVASTNASGAIKSVMGTVSLATNGTTNIGAVIPANSTIIRVKVNVGSIDTAALLAIGDGTTPNRYMTTSENDCSISGLYVSEVLDTSVPTIQIVATVTSTAGAGSATVLVEYKLA